MELLYAPEEVQSDRGLVECAVRQSGEALAVAAEALRRDKELVLQAAAGCENSLDVVKDDGDD